MANTRPPVRRLAFLFALALVCATSPAEAGGGIQAVEKEFKTAIEKVAPATVICVPTGVDSKSAGSSSGVIVSQDGYVLTEGNVGAVHQIQGRRIVGTKYQDEVDVRVPDLEKGGFTTYRAIIVRRLRGADTTLIRILEPPPGGFHDHLPPATSAHLQVGDFNFVSGNAFGMAAEATPTLTAGVVSLLTKLPPGDAGGPIEFVYTSAAVNPGVIGGPCIDIEGRLIGTVSMWLPAVPGEPCQFLGKVMPIDRIRAVFADLPEAAKLFEDAPDRRIRAKASVALERVLRFTARRSRPSVVSLQAKRSQPLSASVILGANRTVEVPRYLGPVSGILVDPDGWVITSLYNLTNTFTLVEPWRKVAPEAELGTGLRAIESLTVHLPGGRRHEARVVAHDGHLGIALLKLDLKAVGTTASKFETLEPAPASAYEVGRFVLALGNPFGAKAVPDPLLTFGILSKVHALDAPKAWRGQWQTDAGVTDGNCGGALVDLQGRLLGMIQVWHPTQHGRNSGIGFVVPWHEIAAVLPRLKEGKSLGRGYLGIRWRQNAMEPTLVEVLPDTPAATGGLLPGDKIVALGGRPTPTVRDVQSRLAFRWEGETLSLTIERDGKPIELEVTLAARP